ncbi:hypothetical protein GCM10007092_12800 [Thermus composti]|nr:hypothetical protein GCM10007092_12800 [Thermus composti]
MLRISESWILFLFWTGLALGVRGVALVATHLYSLWAGFGGFYPLASGADDRFYFEVARRMAAGDWGEVSLPNAYPVFLALFFKLVGPSLFLGKLLNVVLGALGVGVGVLLAERLAPWSGPRWSLLRPANLAGITLSFYPSAVFYSTQLLKDPGVWFLGLLLLYVSLDLWKGFSWRVMLVFFGASLLLWALRPYAVLAIWIALGAFALFKRVRWEVVGALFLVALVAPWLLGWGVLGWNYLAPLLSPEHLARMREEVYGIGGSSLGLQLDPSHPLSFFLVWGYSFVTVWLGPFPWQVDAPLEAIAFFETVYILPWIAPALVGLPRLWRPGPSEFLLIYALVLGAGIGLFSDNLGANTRLRLLVWAAILLYGALHLGGRRAHPLPHHPR